MYIILKEKKLKIVLNDELIFSEHFGVSRSSQTEEGKNIQQLLERDKKKLFGIFMRGRPKLCYIPARLAPY